jgi:hypothetical protein
MYVVFLHISGLAVIEVLFYFFYIGQMETNMFKSNINHILNHETSYIQYSINSTIYPVSQNITNNFYTRAMNGELDREKRNFELLGNALLGLVVIFSITILVIIIELYIKKGKLKRIRSIESVHNVCLEMVEYNQTNQQPIRDDMVEKKEKHVMIYVFHGVMYIVLLVSFEYWLFNYIIMKYKVISHEEIEYLFYKHIVNEQ